MTIANRQLLAWCFSAPHRHEGATLAIGYLLKLEAGGKVSAKLARACRATLDSMRAERARDVARAAMKEAA